MAKTSLVTVRFTDEDFALFDALAKYKGCAITTLVRNCALEQINRELDAQSWKEAYKKYEEDDTTYSLYDLKTEGIS